MSYTKETRDGIVLQVCKAIQARFDVPCTYEYPGFISIPESAINDDTDMSRNYWRIGLNGPEYADNGDLVAEDWSGELTTEDGSRVIGEMAFSFSLKTLDPNLIADALYVHGIGDLYIGGGCTDADCPRRAA